VDGELLHISPRGPEHSIRGSNRQQRVSDTCVHGPQSVSLILVLLPGFLDPHPCLNWLIRVEDSTHFSQRQTGKRQVHSSLAQCSYASIWGHSQ
jgi:hypothetical protein